MIFFVRPTSRWSSPMQPVQIPLYNDPIPAMPSGGWWGASNLKWNDNNIHHIFDYSKTQKEMRRNLRKLKNFGQETNNFVFVQTGREGWSVRNPSQRILMKKCAYIIVYVVILSNKLNYHEWRNSYGTINVRYWTPVKILSSWAFGVPFMWIWIASIAALPICVPSSPSLIAW